MLPVRNKPAGRTKPGLSWPGPAAGVLSLTLGAALAAGLAAPARAQSKVPPGQQPAAPAVSAAPAAASLAAATGAAPAPDRRAPLWAATARFVYADDPALASARAELEQTIDDASLRAFGRSLDDAVRVEQRLAPGQNHVLKLQGIFKDVQAQNLPAGDLAALAEAIQKKLAANPDRMSDPARRQQLLMFAAQLRRLAGPGSPAPAAGAAAPAAAEDGTAVAPAPDATSSAPDTSDPALRLPALATPAPPASSPANSPLPMIALILSALSLLGVLYLLLTRNRPAAPAFRPAPEPPAPRRRAPDPDCSSQQYAELERLVERKLAALITKRAAGNEARPAPKPAEPATPLASPESPSLASITGAAPAADAAPPLVVELAPAPAVAPMPAPHLRTIYVNQPPLDGAFRRDNLADAPASYTIFEITVDELQAPDQGTFVVTRNEAAHGGYIGSHHSILEPACLYSYPQGAVSRIVTDAPGTVQRRPSGDWQIGQKARIHFA